MKPKGYAVIKVTAFDNGGRVSTAIVGNRFETCIFDFPDIFSFERVSDTIEEALRDHAEAIGTVCGYTQQTAQEKFDGLFKTNEISLELASAIINGEI